MDSKQVMNRRDSQSTGLSLSNLRLPNAALTELESLQIRVLDIIKDLKSAFKIYDIDPKISEHLNNFETGIISSLDKKDYRSIPRLLRDFQDTFDKFSTVRKFELPDSLNTWSFKMNFDAVRVKLVPIMASTINKQHFLSSDKRFAYLNEGFFSWAVLGDRGVVLISKNRATEQTFHSYRLRKAIADLLNEYNLEQPKVIEIGSFPFDYCIIERAKGKLISDLVYSKTPPDIATLKTSLTYLGDFFYSLKDLSIDGYGKLIRSTNTRSIAGEHVDIKECYEKLLKRFGQETDNIKTLNDNGILSLEEINKIKEITTDLSKLNDRPILAHGDYHPGNFYINEDNKILALDWDMACMMHPAELLSGLYKCYVQQDLYAVSKDDSKDCFSLLAKNFLNNPNMPECNLDNMFKFLIVRDFYELVPLAKDIEINKDKAIKLVSAIRESLSHLQ
jgi:hypothetical protein